MMPATPHPRLVAEIVDLATEHDYDVIGLIDNVEFVYATISAQDLLNFVMEAECPEAAAAAYEQLVGEWDGEL
ncbi:hypothetical protein [Streptomyces sp. SP18CM02]|uniref:hypothetical protein n=1 Tax=Streptomyces sp. SP18CM02 TaxID=2758571 RepID=UPI00168A49A1|nr:hypothetical protein [Streptomyces sp. SP18CM02]MBD3550861.1 hypothetical protein [Streptomyces sp. SP18CM02]